ncbi:MAG: alpha/beta hydrolase [Gammaproteobacteria bacterium]|nr:alpha/beta hydrolase [Gammaproteobacteria bacterium]
MSIYAEGLIDEDLTMQLDYNRIDPELAPALEAMPAFELTRENIVASRAMLAAMPFTPVSGVHSNKVSIHTDDGPLDVYVYRTSSESRQAAVLWIHGGGYILGNGEDTMAQSIAKHCGCTVFSVDYRLAPEHPFPAGPDDCYAALRWIMSGETGYEVDLDRVAIGGASAGGGMSAGVALMNRDLDNFPLRMQLLLYPMIDNLHATPSGTITNHPVWNRGTSFRAWEMYLNGEPGESASPYAAATRATDLRDLPNAYVSVGSEDLFRDEDIEYARRLSDAGVATELAVFPGLYHGGDGFAPNAHVSKRLRESYLSALTDALRK